MDSKLSTPQGRIEAYLDRLEKMNGTDGNHIHSIDLGEDGVTLTASDIRAVLAENAITHHKEYATDDEIHGTKETL